MNNAARKKFRIVLIVLAALIILLGFFTIHKYSVIKSNLDTVLTNETLLFSNAVSSLSMKESTVQNMVNYLEDKFNQESFDFTKDSLGSYINNVDWYMKSVLIAQNSVHGVWLTINPDLFMNVSNSKITFQNFSYTSWYYKDSNNNIIQPQRNNDRITPETDPYYFKAVKAGSLVITELYTDQKINIEMISLACPIYVKDTLLGVVGIDISKEQLIEAISRMKTKSPSSEIYIFDSKGTFIIGSSHPDKELTDYLQKSSIKSDRKSDWSTILNNKLLLIDDKNNIGPYIVAEISLSKIQGNLKCSLYTLYGMCIILFIFLFAFFITNNKKSSENEISQ